MNEISFIKTEKNVTVFFDGRPHTFPLTDHRIADILNAIRENDVARIRELMNFKQTVADVSEGRITFDPIKRALYFNDEPLHNGLLDRVCVLFEEKLPVANLLRFMDRLMDNPDYRAVNELFRFIEACDLPITPDGHFLAYKIVRGNYFDLHSGKFDNSVGKTPEVPRNQVDADPNVACSKGLHVCSREYLPQYGGFFGGSTSRIMVAKVNPRDVVSVPYDYNNAKMRVCRYEIVDEIPYDEVFGNTRMSGYVTDLYGDPEETTEETEDDLWDDVGSVDAVDDEPETPVTPVVNGKLDANQVRDIVRMLDDGEFSIVHIARLYDVNESTVRKIRDGLIWSHVTGRYA